MRCTRWFTAAPLLALAALGGCRDGAVSPAEPQLQPPAASAALPMSLAPAARPSLSLSGGLPDSASVDFVIQPNGGIFALGNHAIVFPAQSVCDPAVSSYGPGTWDQPCTTLQSPLAVHAEVRRRDGQLWVDFQPSLRFAPSSDPSRWVWLLMYTPEAIGTSDLSAFNIQWANSIGGTTVDEVPNDSTLRTYVDTWLGLSLRRVKHFSGYVSADGRTCTTDCTTTP